MMRWANAQLLGSLVGVIAAQALTAPSTTRPHALRSADCISVHADGEPWDECGFQAYAINGTGNRVLTISTLGTIELWNERGENMTRIVWPDQPGGASGMPNAAVAVRGDTGFAVIHANQLVVINLETGAERHRHILALMSVNDLQLTTDGRLLADARRQDWSPSIYLLDPDSGAVTIIEAPADYVPHRPHQRLGPLSSADGRVGLLAVETAHVGDPSRGHADRDDLHLVVRNTETTVAPE